MSGADEAPKRQPIRMGEVAKLLAERRSAATAYVNIKGSAQGVAQPDVNITPDTLPEDAERMTALALECYARIISETNGAAPAKPEKKTTVVHVRPKGPA